MIRFASFAVFVLSMAFVACDVGTAANIAMGGDGGTSDGGVDAGPVQAHNHCTSGATEVGCTSTSNTSNAGQDCNQANCHGTGGAGEMFEFAGTMCVGNPCTGPAAGATVMFGTTTATTDTEGNFYIAGSNITGSATTNTEGGFMMENATYDCNAGGTCHMAKTGATFPVGGSGSGEGTIYNSD